MYSTEQSMIEARNKISSTRQNGGTVGAKGFSAEGYPPSRSGYAWAVGEHPTDCRPFPRGGELSDIAFRENALS